MYPLGGEEVKKNTDPPARVSMREGERCCFVPPWAVYPRCLGVQVFRQWAVGRQLLERMPRQLSASTGGQPDCGVFFSLFFVFLTTKYGVHADYASFLRKAGSKQKRT